MFLGRVVGSVWSTVKWEPIAGLKMLLVRPYSLSDLGGDARAVPDNDLVVFADVLDAGVGDDVVIAFGHAARVAVQQSLGESESTRVPIDAAVVAVVDRLEVRAGEVAS
jgi:ethanolamine utilization protein EutN